MDVIDRVLNYYGFKKNDCTIEPFGTGLINNTLLLKYNNDEYILQRVNDDVFKNPYLIADNIDKIDQFINLHHPEYIFASPKKALDGKTMVYVDDVGYYRLFPFVKGSHTIGVVQTDEQAFEAAKSFGRFTRMLKGFSVEKLNVTLPHFHDLNLRYKQFEAALAAGNNNRIADARKLIEDLSQKQSIVKEYNNIIKNGQFKSRVTHHDTKISNVLFDEYDKGICVIDLDTVMPGFFISDVGDMMRTYLCPVSEEEEDFTKIEIRGSFYKAIVEGYNVYMSEELTNVERNYFVYAGKFMIYMQALRFLTDYINNDVYYGAKYPMHNFVRAKNQSTLLDRLLEKEKELLKLVDIKVNL